ncbi:uncharacterized protein [Malus domestica]|uniref:uncharacterized protein n=1 Tax=Malus domestica TaxID=3750 RepID=UPI0039768CE1
MSWFFNYLEMNVSICGFMGITQGQFSLHVSTNKAIACWSALSFLSSLAPPSLLCVVPLLSSLFAPHISRCEAHKQVVPVDNPHNGGRALEVQRRSTTASVVDEFSRRKASSLRLRANGMLLTKAKTRCSLGILLKSKEDELIYFIAEIRINYASVPEKFMK